MRIPPDSRPDTLEILPGWNPYCQETGWGSQGTEVPCVAVGTVVGPETRGSAQTLSGTRQGLALPASRLGKKKDCAWSSVPFIHKGPPHVPESPFPGRDTWVSRRELDRCPD